MISIQNIPAFELSGTKVDWKLLWTNEIF